MQIKVSLIWIFALLCNNVLCYLQECATPANTPGRCTYISACPFILYNTGNQEKTIKQIIEEWSCNDQNDEVLVCCPRNVKYKKQTIISETNGTLYKQTLYNLNRDRLDIKINIKETSPTFTKQIVTNEEYGSNVKHYSPPQLPNAKPPSVQPSTTSRRPATTTERSSTTTERPSSTTERPSTTEHPSSTDITYDIPLDIFTTGKTTTTVQTPSSDSIDLSIFKRPLPSSSPSTESEQDRNIIDDNEEQLTPEQQQEKLDRIIAEFYRTYTLPSLRVCGLQHSDDYFSDRNGTRLDEYPWLALLRYQNIANGDSNGFQGAGTLITRQYVLTSAYMVNTDNQATHEVVGVRLGEYNPRTANDCFNDPNLPECTDGALDVPVEEAIVHQQYVPGFRINDIALIRLVRYVDFTDYIRPICLPLPGTRFAEPGEMVVTSGWGTLQSQEQNGVSETFFFRKKRSQPVLLTNNQCEDQFRLAADNLDFIITENMFCTQDFGDEGLCFRDGGIPVMVANNLKWHIEGMFIYTSAVCEKGAISVHTKVSAYLTWILTTIRP